MGSPSSMVKTELIGIVHHRARLLNGMFVASGIWVGGVGSSPDSPCSNDYLHACVRLNGDGMPELVEVIVVFAEAPNQRVVTEFKTHYRVKALVPPRLIVLEIEQSQVADLERLTGVEAVLTGPSTPLPASLMESERLFISGWQQQRGDKRRKGEGLPWDAEGYLPPDKPRPK
jgi:hypothetical protein